MRTVSVRSEPMPASRRYLSLAREAVKVAPMRQRLALTDGPYAETKEKAAGSL